MRPSSKAAYARLLVLRDVVVRALATPPKPILRESFETWSQADREEYNRQCREQAEAHVAGMARFGLWKHASPEERAFLESSGWHVDEDLHRDAGWRVECAATLMWALGIIDAWPAIDVQTDPDLLKEVPVESIGWFTRTPKLRPQGEIEEKRDLLEFWHWRVRTRGLIERGYPFEPDENMVAAGIRGLDDVIRVSAERAYQEGDVPEIMDGDLVFLGKPFRALPVEEYQLAASIIMERHRALNWLCGCAPGNRWDDTPLET